MKTEPQKETYIKQRDTVISTDDFLKFSNIIVDII